MAALEMVGLAFGRLTVVARAASNDAHPRWQCRCSCGAAVVVRGNNLRGGSTRSCGCLARELAASLHTAKLKGRRFGRWKVLEQASNTGRTARWLCRCDCGTERVVNGSELRRGRSRSCGCFKHDERIARISHGESRRAGRSPEYGAWLSMKRRCYDSTHVHYKYYGGRDVKVCKRWLHSYENFLADVGRKPTPLHTLDRYPNPAGDYKPGNVRWATRKQQSNNLNPRR